MIYITVWIVPSMPVNIALARGDFIGCIFRHFLTCQLKLALHIGQMFLMHFGVALLLT